MIGLTRSFVATRAGQVHVANRGTGLPVPLLRQTARSWDEYRNVLPLLGALVRTHGHGHAGLRRFASPGWAAAPSTRRQRRRAGPLRGPTLVIAATDDPHAFPAAACVAAAVPGAIVTEIPGRVPDAMPDASNGAVLAFLRRLRLVA